MLALPGVLMALYLFAAYHQPHAIGPRPYWLQISDHYVYTVYAFVVMGAVMVFDWELIFPDILDVFVLTSLPISPKRLMLSRLMALTIFLALVLFGTNILGAVFFPAVADLHGIWWRHLAAHLATVALAGASSGAFFVTLQGGLLCLVGRKVSKWISPLAQAISIVVLLTIFFLTPLICGHLNGLLNSGATIVRIFPPFWFLGLYERLLWGTAVNPLFVPFARTAIISTVAILALAIAIYPPAYSHRTVQTIEGAETRQRLGRITNFVAPLLHLILIRTPQQRAIWHFITQTLFRSSQLRLYLSIYAGVGISLSLSGLLLLHVSHGSIGFAVSPWVYAL